MKNFFPIQIIQNTMRSIFDDARKRGKKSAFCGGNITR